VLCEPISPELALVDPALASRNGKEAAPVIDGLGSTNGNLATLNGAADAAVESTPSVESLLFKTGAISADQLGEIVRESVLTQRPVAAIALERGLTTPEALAVLSATAANGAAALEQPGDTGEPLADAVQLAPPVALAVAQTAIAEAPYVEAVAQPVPAEVPDVPAVPAVVQEFDLAVPVPLLASRESLDERVQAVVALAAHEAPPVPTPVAPVAPAPEPAPVALQPGVGVIASPGSFAILVRLQTGEQVPVETAATFEHAAELARSLAGRFASAEEWPLVAGRYLRPEAVVSIDITRAIEG
jgi:hypothetical protein